MKTLTNLTRRANDYVIAVAARMMTRELRRARHLIHHLQAGICGMINYRNSPAEIPPGDYRKSGLELENLGGPLLQYTPLKALQSPFEIGVSTTHP